VRWRSAALVLAGGLCGAAGAVLAALGLGHGGLVWWVAGGAATGAVLLGLPLGLLSASRQEASLRRLEATLEAWTDGRMGQRAAPPEALELAGLVLACNRLASAVQARAQTQRRLADADAALARQGAELAALQERHRLARDLHDAVSQRLFGIHLLASAAARAEGASAEVADLEALSREAQAEMRALLLQLRPPALARRPLPQALAELCAEAERLAATRWCLELGALPALGPGLEDGLFRVAAEAVANVQRHAAAGSASLGLSAAQGSLLLVVDDDGRGFQPGEGAPVGMGLQGMRERVQALGGVLRIKSQPGRGTRIEASVPLAPGGAEGR